MVKLAAQHKVKVMLISQPDLLYRFSSYPEVFKSEEKDMLSVIGHKGLRQDWINAGNILYPKLLEVRQQVANDNKNVIGVYRIDDIFDKYPQKFIFWQNDSCHQTPEGIVLIGQYMAELVYEEVFKK